MQLTSPVEEDWDVNVEFRSWQLSLPAQKLLSKQTFQILSIGNILGP